MKKKIVFIVALIVGFLAVYFFTQYKNNNIKKIEFSFENKKLQYNIDKDMFFVTEVTTNKKIKKNIPFTQPLSNSILNLPKTKTDSALANYVTFYKDSTKAFFKVDSLQAIQLSNKLKSIIKN